MGLSIQKICLKWLLQDNWEELSSEEEEMTVDQSHSDRSCGSGSDKSGDEQNGEEDMSDSDWDDEITARKGL